MLKFLNTKTQKLSAMVMTGAMVGLSDAVSAQTFNEYTSDLSERTNSTTEVVTYLSYLGGVALAALGVVGLKQHVENPGNVPMKNGLAKLGFGGMLIALPSLTQVMFETTDAGTGGASYSSMVTPSF